MRTINVSTKQKNYAIKVCSGFENLPKVFSEAFPKAERVFIVSDENVAPLYLGEVSERLGCYITKSFIIRAGESNKTLEAVSSIYHFLLNGGADRNSVLVALGGGVTGDIAGFAAATFMRGMKLLQVPTTLLSQVDSGVGGKTGVDFEGFKNIVGAFCQPDLVYINVDTLSSLPKREFNSGMAEVIKYGLIFDSEFYQKVSDYQNIIMSPDQIMEIIEKCLIFKAKIVENDELDTGERELLNFGHTFGHAIESLKEFELLHGECIALGMRVAVDLSREFGDISSSDLSYLDQLLYHYELPLFISGLSLDDIYEAMKHDKKAKSGNLSLILLKKVGVGVRVKGISESAIKKSLKTIMEG